MRLGMSNDLATCAGSSACVSRVASVLRVDGWIATDVVASGKRYYIRVQLLDSQGREISRAEETCEICTLKEADDAAARATAQLWSRRWSRPSPEPEPVCEARARGRAQAGARGRAGAHDGHADAHADLVVAHGNAAPADQPCAALCGDRHGGVRRRRARRWQCRSSSSTASRRATSPIRCSAARRCTAPSVAAGRCSRSAWPASAASGTLFYFDWKQRGAACAPQFGGAPGTAMLQLGGTF